MTEITRDSSVPNQIEIVLAVHDPKGTYSQHAGVVMTSIFEHTTSPVRVHILHDETLTDDNHTKLQRTAEKYNQCVEFHDLTERIKKFRVDAVALADRGVGAASPGALFRLFIPEVLPNADRVIYLDCDVIVNLDICELWSLDMKNNCLAGVLDWTKPLREKFFSADKLRLALMGLRLRDYVNSGVLLLDLKKIHALPESMVEAAPEWFACYERLNNFMDQNFINAFFHGSILHIPDRFNKMVTYRGYDDNDAAIVHFAGTKPWRSARNIPSNMAY